MNEPPAASAFSPDCAVVRAGQSFVGKQCFIYAAAISAESVGAKAKAHKHEAHETAIYVLSGEAGTYYGERLENHIVSRAGDFVYIPANVPHLPYNMSATEPCVAVVARTDANEQESVVLLPHLEAIHG